MSHALPTEGVDAHGYKCALHPHKTVIPETTLYSVRTYAGLSYNVYEVQLAAGAWPTAEAMAHAIEHAHPIHAHWREHLAASRRTLTVYRD